MSSIDSKRFKTNFFPGVFNIPGMRFMLFYRLCNTYKNTPLSPFFKAYYRFMQAKYGFQIPYTTRIGDGLFLGHYGNIVVNSSSIIGKNCNIAQGVTIGAVSQGKYKGYPNIGNEVWIGANAVVVGNIIIGNNVLIAPLSFVNRDVPDNAVVMGNPAVEIKYSGSAGYINNKV